MKTKLTIAFLASCVFFVRSAYPDKNQSAIDPPNVLNAENGSARKTTLTASLIQSIPAVAESYTEKPVVSDDEGDVTTRTITVDIQNTGDRPIRTAYADVVEVRSDGTTAVYSDRKIYWAFDGEPGILPGQTGTLAHDRQRFATFSTLRSQNPKIIYVRITKISERYIAPEDTPPPTFPARAIATIPVSGG